MSKNKQNQPNNNKQPNQPQHTPPAQTEKPLIEELREAVAADPDLGKTSMTVDGTYFTIPSWLDFFKNKWLSALIVACVSFIVYANTITHNFAVDDAIVVTRNQFTRLGLKGMYGIWSEDTFVGFFGKTQNLVTGGRYRPFSVATFALEMELWGDHPKNDKGEYLKTPDGDYIKDAKGNYLYDLYPHVSHTINILLYALLCVLIYFCIRQLMLTRWGQQYEDPTGWAGFVGFAAALLYATHPVHTEAVANIKGRDEILVMMGSVMALHYAFRASIAETPVGKVSCWTMAALGFLMGIFSKESAVTFLAIIPAALYIFRPRTTLAQVALYTLPFIALTAIFWFGIRARVLVPPPADDPIAQILEKLSADMYKGHKTAFFWVGNEPTELMNNPFLKLVNNRYVPYNDSERLGTILYTWFEYARLLSFPHPLTNDYYPYHITVKARNSKIESFRDFEVPTMGHGIPLFSLLLHGFLGFWGLWLCYKRRPMGFVILFYFATFSVVSNFFFPIGTNMAERFMFMPSLAFSFACALGLLQLGRKVQWAQSILPLLVVVAVLYSLKTFSRNYAWKDDYTLFTTDIETSPNSAKLNNAVSGVLQDDLVRRGDLSPQEREEILRKALKHSTNAINMHPTYNNAWLLYGNANTMLAGMIAAKSETENQIFYINGKQMQLPSLQAAAALYDEGARAYAEVMRLRPDHPDAPTNLGVAMRDKAKLVGERLGRAAEALALLQSAQKFLPNDPETFRLLGITYGLTGQLQLAINSLEKAVQLMPQEPSNWFNLGIAYKNGGLEAESQQCFAKAKELNPNFNPNPNAVPNPMPNPNSTTATAPTTPTK